MSPTPSRSCLPPYYRPKRCSDIRLFCFPYAGGGALTFRGWDKHLGENIDIIPIQLPGHESRIGEPCLTSIDVLVDDLIKHLEPLFRGRFLLFGHSLARLSATRLPSGSPCLAAPNPNA